MNWVQLQNIGLSNMPNVRKRKPAKWLSSLCNKSDMRPVMQEPFVSNGYEVATDGFRVHAIQSDVQVNTEVFSSKNIDRLFKQFQLSERVVITDIKLHKSLYQDFLVTQLIFGSGVTVLLNTQFYLEALNGATPIQIQYLSFARAYGYDTDYEAVQFYFGDGRMAIVAALSKQSHKLI